MDSPRHSGALGVAYQIPRNTLALLMVAEAVVILPYLFQLSPWLIAVGLFCGYWRAGVYQGRWDYPPRWVKLILVVLSVLGALTSGADAFSLETAASLLIAAFALKLIEMKSRRDAYLVIFLSYFVIATQFLFDQSILITLYELGAMIVVTAALVGLNQLHTRVRPLASMKIAATLVLQALPLTIVLFLLFPRIAPLWSVPLPSSGSTGISDTVTPGAFEQLTQSDALALRVVFDGRIPLPRDLYWRGLVYSELDGSTWRADKRLPPLGESGMPEEGESFDYEVLLEPTQRTWLFGMNVAHPLDAGVRRTRDQRIEVAEPVLSVFRYRVRSFPQEASDLLLNPVLRTRELQLPGLLNPRARSFAAELRARHDDDAGFAAALLTHIRERPYRYTLNPPRYPDPDPIDAFWFDGRAGFCSHYAGAFVFMMRAAGIPARMIGGYQGGEINPLSGHLMVRQYDAHAWAEIWLDGVGWQRFDPTAAVAPERIERGLSSALSAEDRATLSLLTSARLGDWALASRLLQWADSMEHRWNLWVVGYDNRFQSDLLSALLGEMTPARMGLALLVGGALSLGAVAIALFWRRRSVRRNPVEQFFLNFSKRLTGQGQVRQPWESPPAFVRRVADAAGLEDPQVATLIADLEQLLYNPTTASGPAELGVLRRALRRLQFRLALRIARQGGSD
ncbi:MAG: DUF3488 and transglutaminase-like domain-containing protein [Pseudomonadales bacterium]